MEIHPKHICGNWQYGSALDLHTLSSVPLFLGGYDTKRTEIGEALYRLKYCNDRSMITPIAETAASYLSKEYKVFPHLKAIVPAPPSKLDRQFQPVFELAQAISALTGLPVAEDYLLKTKQTQIMKGNDDARDRQQQLKDAFDVVDRRYAGSYLLVFDDLYRSGDTMNAICNTLVTKGRVARVYTLAITSTRTKQ